MWMNRIVWRLWRAIDRQAFAPGCLGVMVNPFYFARAALYGVLKQKGSELTGRLLDIGCGCKPYQKLVVASEYIGMEYDTESARLNGAADVYYKNAGFPFPDESFDSALCTQVLEHVFDARTLLFEICRVLKPNGRLLITTPFIWDEHEQPHDYMRYTSYGLKRLLADSGFEILEQKKTLPDLRVICQLVCAYIYKRLHVANRVVNVILMLMFIFPVNIAGLLLYRVLPTNDDLYLDNVVLVRKKAVKT